MTRCLLAIIAASMTTVALPAFAQTAGDDSARSLTDPNYLPYQGAFFGTTGYSYSTQRGDFFDNGGADRGSFRVNSNTIEQTLGYGITDDFAVILSDSYVPLSRRTFDPVGAPSFDRDRSGLNDPGIEAIYRVMDERSNPVLVDLFASYSPDLIDQTSSDALHEGSAARGGQSGTFGMALGHEWGNWGVRGTAHAEWLDSREIQDSDSHTLSREGSSWDYGLDLTSQVRFDDLFSANLGTGYAFRQTFDGTRTVTDTGFVTHPGDFGNVHASLNYQLTPGAAAALTYQFNDYANRDTRLDATPGIESATRSRTENIFGVKFDYALN